MTRPHQVRRGYRRSVSADPSPKGAKPAPSAQRTRWLAAAAVAAGIVVASAVAPAALRALNPPPPVPVGAIAPEVSLPALTSPGTLQLSDFRGRVVVLNFWASWCAPCNDEAPVLAEAALKWRGRGVVFVGIDGSDSREAAAAFVTRHRINYDSMVDGDGATSAAWGVNGYPQTFVIDASGRIASRHVSALDAPALEAAISAAVG